MAEPLSGHCSLMSRPPKPAERPADCPVDAAYIRTAPGAHGKLTLPSADFPIVFEGGAGDDQATVVGHGGKGVLVVGGGGRDSLTVESDAVWLAGRLGPAGVLFIAALAMVLATVGALAWRALGPSRRG